mmetsp:Transcript_30546/g.77801  ORF Transcript_30546/g.77801 Transcript_30546/m.77801 type:complete len:249 (-) Transcript_30546:378-1124(-)
MIVLHLQRRTWLPVLDAQPLGHEQLLLRAQPSEGRDAAEEAGARDDLQGLGLLLADGGRQVALAERQQRGNGLGAHGRATGPRVDDGQLTEEVLAIDLRGDVLLAVSAGPAHFTGAPLDDEELISDITLSDDDLARLEVPRPQLADQLELLLRSQHIRRQQRDLGNEFAADVLTHVGDHARHTIVAGPNLVHLVQVGRGIVYDLGAHMVERAEADDHVIDVRAPLCLLRRLQGLQPCLGRRRHQRRRR